MQIGSVKDKDIPRHQQIDAAERFEVLRRCRFDRSARH
jgi:hypothetical protein